MCLKNMINDVGSYDLDRSVSARMAISKQGTPLKALCVHRSCSTPLWKVVIFLLGVTVGLMAVCCIMKKCRCSKESCEE